MQTTRHTVRNIDKELITEARIFALQTGQNLGDVINQSLENYLYEDDEGDVQIVEDN
ncbi:hypothetical protein [Planktotalea sp.]|uniref:hypothetical protein n=1 Tax=Planktotalea sp. TaxID=2029877 RepID=UPI00329A69AC